MLDHLASIAALMLVVRGWPMLLKTLTAFAVAYLIMLTTFGYASLPLPPVEALIALSILLVTAEAVRLRRGHYSLASQWSWIVASFWVIERLGAIFLRNAAHAHLKPTILREAPIYLLSSKGYPKTTEGLVFPEARECVVWLVFDNDGQYSSR